MFIDKFTQNMKKAIKVVQVDGFIALVRILRYKITIAMNWNLIKIFSRVDSADEPGFSHRKLVLFAGVPYDDIGGGQRAAQLTRAALRTGIQVLYVYIFPKYDVNKRAQVVSKVNLPHLLHKSIKELTQQEFLKFINQNTTVVFELPHPLYLEYIDLARMRGVRTIFELIDDWSTGLGGDWYSENVFRRYVTDSDTVIGTAKVLTKQLVERGRKDAIYLPNAANEYIFDNTHPYRKPTNLPKGPIALYMGSLYGEWFGWEYIKKSAELNDDHSFCLIGSKPPNLSTLLPKNVYFLGEKRIEDLPKYLSLAEFCLLPFKPGQITDAVSPIKAFEYIFMGKPIIATNMVEVTDFPLVFPANTELEFANQCQKIKGLSINLEAESSNIDKFIAKNSWFLRLQQLIGLSGKQNVSAIILMYNNRHIIERCLRSLLDNCSSYLADVIVVDNASEDGGAEYVLENFPQVRLVKNPVNGCSSGRNLGVQSSTGKYLAFFDSDQWFTSAFCMEEALSILESHAEIGAVGWAAGWLDLSDDNISGPLVDYFPNRAMNAEATIKGYRTDITYLGSGGLFIPRPIFEATGGFDSAYDPTSFEDTDLSFAIKQLGFEIVYRDLTGIRHEAHLTTKAAKKSAEYLELFSRNSKYFLNKWRDYRHFMRSKNKWFL